MDKEKTTNALNTLNEMNVKFHSMQEAVEVLQGSNFTRLMDDIINAKINTDAQGNFIRLDFPNWDKDKDRNYTYTELRVFQTILRQYINTLRKVQ